MMTARRVALRILCGLFLLPVGRGGAPLAVASEAAQKPAPAPRQAAARYRTNTIDPRARRVPAAIRQGVFAQPQRYLPPLVRSLIEGVDDEFLRVKILHDWVADNIAYDVASYLAGTRVDTASEETLRHRKSVCHGYAVLLAKMCQLAGIPCEKVSGYGRGYRFGLGRAENLDDVNHAWNAVHVRGRWYLLDVTWDAGHVDQRAFQKAYSTTYLFLEPRQFLYTHFPAEPKWQLLDPPRTAEQFAELPYLRGRFFEHGLRLVTPLRRTSRAGRSVQFALELPADVQVIARLKASDGSPLARRTLVQRDGGRCRILAAFPHAGRWKVYVHSKRSREPGTLWLAAWFEFESTGGTPKTFPETFGAYGRLGGCLHGPLFVPLAGGKPLQFRIGLRGTRDVFLAIGERPWLQLAPAPGEPDVYQLTAAVPPGVPVKLTAKTPGDGGKHWTLVDFTPDRK
jgi:hypothetical protein